MKGITGETEATIRRMWIAGKSQAAIANATDIPDGSVYFHVKRMGLPARKNQKPGNFKAGKKPSGDAVAAPDRPTPFRRSTINHPFWTEDRDQLVANTHGRYHLLASLAPVLGLSTTQVTARWLQIRLP